MTTLYDFKIGTTSGGMTNLELLTVPVVPPQWFYQPGAEVKRLANLQLRYLGYPLAQWNWGFLTNAQRDQLKTFCTGASAEVYIRTLTLPSTYINARVAMYWPLQEIPQAGRRINFQLAFVILEVL